MPTMETIECASCGQSVEKPLGEVTRSKKLGRPMFCGLSCSATHRNATRKAREFEMTCECGEVFTTTTRNKAKRHCSRSCASRFSMTRRRRSAQRAAGKKHKQNLDTAKAMRSREAWKYSLLREELGDRPHEFEFELGGRIFDLALLDTKMLVEFDGPSHREGRQRMEDGAKDKLAAKLGWRVVRREVKRATVIHPSTIEDL